MANKQKALMWLMFVIIVILAVVVVYAFLVKPAISGFVVQKQTEGLGFGYQQCINDVISTAAQGQPVQLPMSDGGTLVLQATQVIPPQQAAPAQ